MPNKNSGKKPTKPEGNYVVDSDQLAYAYVSGTYSDQGCMTVTWESKPTFPLQKHRNHKGGDFKIHPGLIVDFFKKIGVTLHFETDRKHSYCRSIELKPWSEFEQELRQPDDRNKESN
jgi:hypothetical protein